MKKSAVILIIILLIVASGGYFLYYKLTSGELENTVGVAKITDTNFDMKIFSNEKFGELKQFAPLPIEVGQKGKINPFMKF